MLGAWCLIAAFAGLAQQADSALILRAVRFYRADPTQSPGQTHVTAFLRIPAELPTPGPAGEVSLRFSFRVVDSAGGTLYQQSWPRRIGVPFPRGEADRLDLIRFTLGAGRYRLEASVVDSVSGRKVESAVPIVGYGAPPAVSDLLISPSVRPVASIDTIPQPGEFRRGGLIVAMAPEVVVGGAAASLAYLFESYAGTSAPARLTLTVLDDAGAERMRVGPADVRLAAGIGLLTGQLDVGDLPPADYRLRAILDLGGRSVTREGHFAIDPTVASAPSALSDEDYFSMLSGPELDQAFAPLAAIAEPRELARWPARGSDAAKRELLAEFWEPRDPTPGTRGNERRAQFYDGVVYTNAFYADGRRGLPGWQTDRGRVFLREGLPTQVLRRQQRGTVPAYEVWRYFDPDDRYYLFVDRGRTGFGLMRSNDPRERDDRRWQQSLTPAGVREVVNFLGRAVLTPD